ncbi:TonB-dependent receptor [Massilia arenosa]|uniref:TonB-dependent receptor n=1 Tax=Zemynaea arenosa TaxID=2561931 RepID=A0A4Y9S7E5_9BURK|nr:TonB-dependent receptor [Massilia arenosa]TFW17529.1 TonB-dependent receptor [Massilia arenosa]
MRPLPPPRLRPLPALLSALLTVSALPAQAQAPTTPPPPPPDQAAPMARVEITGSNIRRAQAETAEPVQSLTRADLEKSGRTNVAELMQTLAVDNQGSVPMGFGAGFAAGASAISLRGLGAASTLVLLNGRRVASYGFADDAQKLFTDLNIIPLDAVDRVEILKGGASAIYGSDAVAGVVNIILRRDYVGNLVRFSQGLSEQKDGGDTRFGLTHGHGNLDTDGYNFLMTVEYGKRRAIWNRDRADRAAVGRSDLRPWGYSAQQTLSGFGTITGPNASGSSVSGNVRNPSTDENAANFLNYYNRGSLSPDTGFTRTFPGAACSNFTNHPQGDPGGGCLTDATQQFGQVQPSQENGNLYARYTMQLNPAWQAYAEVNGYVTSVHTQTTPSGVSASVGYPGGPVSNADVRLGADHPDNPYFGSSARIRYLAQDVGPRHTTIRSNFARALLGLKGSWNNWDIETGLLYSENKGRTHNFGFLQRDITFALLNPSPANVAAAQLNPLYAALPPGTVWRIAENAALNSPAVYAALSPEITADATSRMAQFDVKGSSELTQLPGGPLAVAVGLEARRDRVELTPTTGTERGNIIGLGFSAYEGKRTQQAVYGEVVAPVVKQIELTAALRYDHYQNTGNTWNPQAGIKWTPVRSFALRAAFARGFRAPSPAENGRGGLAAFSTAEDPQRCALGVEVACSPAAIALITSPNPDLSPERSKSYSLGAVWDPVARTNVSVDFWRIKRTNEINQEQVTAAIERGNVARDPAGAEPGIPGDPGPIVAVLTRYINSNQTDVRGVDLDARTSIGLPGGYGALAADIKWTRLFRWQRTEPDGTVSDFAGTHGNCDVTNCIGTPKDRANLNLSWDSGPVRLTATVNYRGKLDNRLRKEDAECAVTFDDGSDAPPGCKIASFTTVDLTGRWKLHKQVELFASIQNLFDREPPLDPLTYGAAGYNPLDQSGAIGRYYEAGLRWTF